MKKQDQGKKSQEQISFEDESNLLDSYTQNKFKKLTPESDHSSEEYLNEVEYMLEEQPRKKMTSEEIILEAQVMELQMKCQTLAKANQRLLDKLEENMEIDEKKKNLSKQQLQSFTSVTDISFFQGQLSELEEYVLAFKDELLSYQKKVEQHLKNNDEKLNSYQLQVEKLEREKHELERAVKEEIQSSKTLMKRNEDLLMELEEEKDRKTVSESGLRMDYSYRNEFQYELQSIIQKLAAELKHEKNMKKKHYQQIKDLGRQLSESEKTIQKKNQTIYNLELKLLRGEKKNISNDVSLKGSQSVKRLSNLIKKKVNENGNQKRQKFVNLQLQAVLNEQVQVRQEGLLLIGCRLIDLYQLQMQKKEIKLLMSGENIRVENFNEKSLALMKVGGKKYHKHISVEKQEFWAKTVDLVVAILNLCYEKWKNQEVFGLLEELEWKMKEDGMWDMSELKNRIEDLMMEGTIHE